MNHQPFENWLLSDEPLQEQDSFALAEHLENCSECGNLQDAWENVVNLMTDTPDLAPQPGFVSRWQTALESERQAVRAARERWQSWILAIFIANGAALTLILLGIQVFQTYESFTDLVLSWVYRAAVVVTLASGLQNVFSTLIRTIPGVIPASWLTSAVVVLSISAVVWIISLKKLSSLPRRTT
jgi:hypothetical protein